MSRVVICEQFVRYIPATGDEFVEMRRSFVEKCFRIIFIPKPAEGRSRRKPGAKVLILLGYLRPISTQENFPQKENFVKCDWLIQNFLRKKIRNLKIFDF